MITNPPQDATVVEGENVTFQCAAMQNGSPDRDGHSQ